MTAVSAIGKVFARAPGLATVSYAVVIVVLCYVAVASAIGSYGAFWSLQSERETLERVETRARLQRAEQSETEHGSGSRSPFLEGQTSSVASAALLQRISLLISEAGGSVQSSEINPSGADGRLAPSKLFVIRETVSFEIEQSALQRLLYRLEAETPIFLIEQVTINPVTTGDGSRLRVSLQMSGQWLGAN
jgi:general secretion pathway protein M